MSREEYIDKKQAEYLKKILTAALITGAGAFGAGELLSGFSEGGGYGSPKRKDRVYLPGLDNTDNDEKPELNYLDKFSSEKAANEERIDLFSERPSTLPLTILASLGGLYGGYKGLDYLTGKLEGHNTVANEEDLLQKQRELLKQRYELLNRGHKSAEYIEERADSAYEKFMEDSLTKSAEEDGWLDSVSNSIKDFSGINVDPLKDVANKVYGYGGGAGITAAALLWLLAHGKTKQYFSSLDPNKKYFDRLKSKLKHTDISLPATGHYIERIKSSYDTTAAAGAPGETASPSPEESPVAASNSLGNKLDIVAQSSDASNRVADKIRPAATEAANDPATGSQMAGVVDKNEMMEGVNKGVGRRLGSILPGFLLQREGGLSSLH